MASHLYAEIMAAVQKPTRTARLHVIQEQIAALRPNAWEAGEIIDSVEAALKLNYEGRAEESLLYLKHSREALERLDTGWEVLP